MLWRKVHKALLVGLAASLLTAPFARAQTPASVAPAPQVAVTTTRFPGLNEAARPGFRVSLYGGLAAAGLRVLDGAKVAAKLKAHGGLGGCETSVCLKRIGAILAAPLLGRATVEKAGGTTFRIEVVLSLASTGAVAAKRERSCELCTLKEAREALSKAAAEAGAEARTKLGPVPAARRRIAVARRRVLGHADFPTDRRRKPDPWTQYRFWGLVTAGVGAALLIPGAVMLGLHGKVQSTGCGAKKCIWDSRGGGGAATAIGVTAVLGGVGLFLYGYLMRQRWLSEPVRDKPAATVGIGPVPYGRGALVTGRFEF